MATLPRLPAPSLSASAPGQPSARAEIYWYAEDAADPGGLPATKFGRLHALVVDQFREQSARLMQDSRPGFGAGDEADLLAGDPPAGRRREQATAEPATPAIAELAARHDAFIVRLLAGLALCRECFGETAPSQVLEDLLVRHQKESFLLRTLVPEEKVA